MLRVKAKQAAYWKAAEPRHLRRRALGPVRRRARARRSRLELPDRPGDRRALQQEIKVNVRNLRSAHVRHRRHPARRAGDAEPRRDPQRPARHLGLEPHAAPRRHLHGGRSTRPSRPSASCARAGSVYDRDLRRVPHHRARRAAGPAPSGTPPASPPRSSGSRSGTSATPPGGVPARASATWRRGRATPSACSSAPTAQAHVGARRSGSSAAPTTRSTTSSRSRPTSAAASPTPRRRPPSRRTLEGFLFDTKSGYCQQYSGAMALLLRMGGIPARVATGFTSGSYDRKAKEYVVRDLDAHSWVEAWFPDYGWVTFDPTPVGRAAALAEQPTAATPRHRRRAPTSAARRARPAHRPRGRGRTPWELYAGLGLLGALLLGGGVFALPAPRPPRRPRCPSSSARCGAPAATPGPGATLQALEASLRALARRRGLRARAARPALRRPRRARRRAPSGAACAASWGAAAACADGCAHGGRCPRGDARPARTLDAHG